MHLLDHANAAAGGQYTHGDPKTVPRTEPSGHTLDSLNAFQEEIITPLEDVGQVLDKTNKAQLSKVIALSDYATQRPRTGTQRFAVGVDLNDVAYINLPGITSRWIAVGDTTDIWHSEEADIVQNWAQSTVLGGGDLKSIAVGAGVVIVVGTGGAIVSSADGGVTWTDRSGVTANDLNRVVFAAGSFVAAGASGTIIQSADGITWNLRSSGLSANINALAYNGAIFLALEAGIAQNATSSDGITWANASTVSPLVFFELTASTRTGKWFATIGGSIITSTDEFESVQDVEVTSGTAVFLSIRYITELDAIVTAGFDTGPEAESFQIGFGDTAPDWAIVYDVEISPFWNAVAFGPGYFLAMADTGVWARSYASLFNAFA